MEAILAIFASNELAIHVPRSKAVPDFLASYVNLGLNVPFSAAAVASRMAVSPFSRRFGPQSGPVLLVPQG